MRAGHKIDLLQERQIRWLFGIVAFIGGITTILVYLQDRHSKKQRTELDELERELKILQLEKLKADKRRNGF
jgi:hypothetical protein